jgi:hypothetical protein
MAEGIFAGGMKRYYGQEEYKPWSARLILTEAHPFSMDVEITHATCNGERVGIAITERNNS